jgi:hypothetical protein
VRDVQVVLDLGEERPDPDELWPEREGRREERDEQTEPRGDG